MVLVCLKVLGGGDGFFFLGNLARCMNPIENGDFPASHVSLLEGITHNHQEFQVP